MVYDIWGYMMKDIPASTGFPLGFLLLGEGDCHVVKTLRQPHWEELKWGTEVSAISHVGAPSWKWIFQPQSSFQMRAAQDSICLPAPARPWCKPTQLNCSWIPGPQKLQAMHFCCPEPLIWVVISHAVGLVSACNAGDPGSVSGLERFPGEGSGYPLQNSYLGNSMDREAWQTIPHGVLKSQTQPSGY